MLDLLQGSVYDLLQGLLPQQMPDSLQSVDPLQKLDLLQGSDYDLLQSLPSQQMPDSLQGLDPLQKLDLLQGSVFVRHKPI